MPGNTTKRYSNFQEKRIAKNLGGDKQLASGALPIPSKKGDVKVNQSSNWKLLVDGKTTMAKTYEAGVRSKTLHKDDLLKVEQQAREGGYDIGVLAVSFDNKVDYYVSKDVDFRNMYDALRDYEGMVEQLTARVKELEEKLTAQSQQNEIKPRYAEIQLEE
jgi:hypothetical protein